MPYASNRDLPENLQAHLPEHAQDIFRAAFNAAWRQHAADPDVEWIAPNVRFELVSDIPVRESSRPQWALEKVRAPEAWAMAGNGGFWKITVGVIDTGVDYRHKNLSRNMVAGYDFRDNDNDPDDVVSFLNAGHGTHCAGVIAADGRTTGEMGPPSAGTLTGGTGTDGAAATTGGAAKGVVWTLQAVKAPAIAASTARSFMLPAAQRKSRGVNRSGL